MGGARGCGYSLFRWSRYSTQSPLPLRAKLLGEPSWAFFLALPHMDSWLSTGSFGGAKRVAQSQGTSTERASSPSLKRSKVSDNGRIRLLQRGSSAIVICHARQDAVWCARLVLRWPMGHQRKRCSLRNSGARRHDS